MRIAIFHNLPSGGAKRTLYEQARRLKAAHTLDVFSLSSADHTFGDIRPHVAHHTTLPFAPLPLLHSPFGRVNQVMRLADLYRLRRPLRQLARQIEAGQYDLLLAHPCQIETASSLLTYLHGRLPIVYYCHEPPRRLYEDDPPRPYGDEQSWRRRTLNRIDPLPPLYRTIVRRLDWRNTRRANLVLVNSAFTQKNVSDVYGTTAEISYHAVDTDWFRPLALPQKRMILSVGSLTPLKGFDFLIEAVATIPAAERPPLALASNFQNPPERDYLTQLAADLGVELELLGNIDDETLRRLYNEAAVTAYTPHREPFGLVPVEAMACGAAVVAIREGGVPESVVHEETGLLAERDPALFGAALRRLLADPELAASYGRNGRAETLRRWTWDIAIERLETHLNAVAQNR